MLLSTIKRFMLEDLLPNTWGRKHKEFKNVIKGLPFHLMSSQKGKKLIQKALKELIKEELIFVSKKRLGKTSDLHFSLNP
jgi:hypothetical protein